MKGSLRQLALDVRNRLVFGSWMIPEHSLKYIHIFFTPLALMNSESIEQIKNEGVVHFYEYYSEAGPRVVNGLPVFSSFYCLKREEFEELMRLLQELKDAEDAFLNQEKP